MMEEQQQLLSTGHVVVDRVTVSVIDKRLTEDIIEQLEGVQPQVGPAKLLSSSFQAFGLLG